MGSSSTCSPRIRRSRRTYGVMRFPLSSTRLTISEWRPTWYMLSWKLTIKRRANYEQHTKPLWANATGTSVVTIGSRPVVRRFWLVGPARVRVANFWSSAGEAMLSFDLIATTRSALRNKASQPCRRSGRPLPCVTSRVRRRYRNT